MRIVYIIRSTKLLEYHTSVLENLIDNRTNKIYLGFDRKWSDEEPHVGNLQAGRFETFWIKHRKGFFRFFIFPLRELCTVIHYFSHPEQSDYYKKRWEKYLPFGLRVLVRIRLFQKFILHRKIKSIIERIEKRVPPSQVIMTHLQELHPDIVVISPGNLRYSEEIEYIKAAGKMHIPTVISVLSWDNLTTKGLFHCKPDNIFVWNQNQRDEAINFHHMNKKDIIITGSPFFDKWFDFKESEEQWKKFLLSTGMSENEKYITYVGSSENIAEDESAILMALSRKLVTHPNPSIRNLYIIFRPHPANSIRYENLHASNLIVFPKKTSYPFSVAGLSDLYYSLKGSIAVIGINTSGMLDTLVLDKPCIALLDPKYTKTQEDTLHFHLLQKSYACEEVRGVDETIERVQEILSGVDRKKKKRKEFIKKNIRPLGERVAAGYIQAQMILRLAKLHGQKENI